MQDMRSLTFLYAVCHLNAFQPVEEKVQRKALLCASNALFSCDLDSWPKCGTTYFKRTA